MNKDEDILGDEKNNIKREKEFEKQIELEREEGQRIIKSDPYYEMNKWIWENRIRVETIKRN